MAPPDFQTLPLAELLAWQGAIAGALAVARELGRGADLDFAILADDEGVSVTFSIPLRPLTP